MIHTCFVTVTDEARNSGSYRCAKAMLEYCPLTGEKTFFHLFFLFEVAVLLLNPPSVLYC